MAKHATFTQAEINRVVKVAKAAGAYAVEIKGDTITIILHGGDPKSGTRVIVPPKRHRSLI